MTICSKKSRRAAMDANAAPTPPAPTRRIFMSGGLSSHGVSTRARWRSPGSTSNGSVVETSERELLADVVHDVLEAGVVLEPVDREVLAVAGVLEPAVRHLGDERDVGVHPDAPEVELLRHPHRAAVVLGPHRGGEAVLDAVGPGERLGLVGELLDGDDRAEDLGLDLLVVLLEAREHRGLVEVAGLTL